MNDDGLREVFPNVYAESEASGTADFGDPGSNGFGFIQQNCLEGLPNILLTKPAMIAGICLVVVFLLLIEIRRLHRRLDDVIAHLSDQDEAI